VGWRGQIATSPTGGDVGCAGAAVGGVTPGWCTGGSAIAGTANGSFARRGSSIRDLREHGPSTDRAT
jgi:hypothetical protein